MAATYGNNAEHILKNLGSFVRSKEVNALREKPDFLERTELQKRKDALYKLFLAYRKLKGFLTKPVKGVSNVKSVIDDKMLTLLMIGFAIFTFSFSKENFITNLEMKSVLSRLDNPLVRDE